MRRSISPALCTLLLGTSLAPVPLLPAPARAGGEPLRFVLIPKVSHPWFEVVRQGAEDAARMLAAQTGRPASVDYQPPARAEIALQEALLRGAIRSRPSGITIDLLDGERLRPLLAQARAQGIPVTVFDSEAPAELGLTSIGNDYCQQARIASERLVQLLGGQGEVAIMQGVPTAPNHAIRTRCHREVFARHAGIRVVAQPVDNDDIGTAERRARETMVAFPALRGWVVSDAGGGIGAARAVQALGRAAQVKVIGLDDLPEMQRLIQTGLVDSTAATKPRSQGYWSVLTLWQQRLGAPPIERIDTGISVQPSR